MRLGVLGSLLVVNDAGGQVPLPVRQRTLLAALLVRANQAVPMGELTELVWDGTPPHGAPRTLRTYVVRLRRAVGPAVAARILTRDPGYLIRVEPAELDTLQFEALCGRAGAALRAGAWAKAADASASALALWRGEPLLDIPGQVLRDEFVSRLDHLRVQALEDHAEAQLRLGRHEQLVPRLRELTGTYPLRERFHAQLMLALARADRQAEALEAYQHARRVLIEQLGVEPGPQLRDLHQRILAGDGGVQATAREQGATAVAAATSVAVPRQLPAAAGHFTGRHAELDALTGLLAHTGQGGGAVVISAIGGMAGVGKTALAVHWAHKVAGRFPDGQLYVNLRGYDTGDPARATDVLEGFLRTLGVGGQSIPADEAQRASLYRSLLAGRRMLIVLDNARAADQVRPLLPGTPGCLVLVTSRDALAGLVAREGAVRVELDALALDEATRLLRALIGSRATADPTATAALAECCCRLPLALRIAAELAAARPTVSLSALVDELTDRQRRLDMLHADGDTATAVREVFSWSYRHLDEEAARAFRLLALHPGVDFDPFAAAALTGTDLPQAHRLLDRLARAHLVQTTGAGRYAIHDLLRAYGRDLAAIKDCDAQSHAALTGLFDYYLFTAAEAVNTLYPSEASRRPEIAAPDGPVPAVAEAAEALAWLDAERANLVAAALQTAQDGWPSHTARLSAVLFRYLSMEYISEARVIHGLGREAAARLGDTVAEATALRYLGNIDFVQARYAQADDLYHQALDLMYEAGDTRGQAFTLFSIATIERHQARYPQAIGHYQQVLDLGRALGDWLTEARARDGLGLMHLYQGHYTQAEEHLHEALDLYCGTRTRAGRHDAVTASGESGALTYLGITDKLLGRYAQAIDRLQRAVDLSRQFGDVRNEVEALIGLAAVELRQGRCAQSAERLRSVAERCREIDDRYAEADALNLLGLAMLRQDRAAHAAELLHQSLALCREMGHRRGEIDALLGFGETLLARGQAEQALAHHAAALDLADQTGARYQQACSHHGLAHDFTALGEHLEAQNHLSEALKIYTELAVPEADLIRAETSRRSV
jgi:DNA-binding SARP family transcriptional activator